MASLYVYPFIAGAAADISRAENDAEWWRERMAASRTALSRMYGAKKAKRWLLSSK